MSSIINRLIFELENQLKFPNISNFLKDEKAVRNYHKDFTKRLQHYGCTERNGELKLNKILLESAHIISNLSLSHLCVTGNARGSKTLLTSLFMLDLPLHTGADTLTVFPTEALRDKVVPTYTKTLRNAYWKRLKLDVKPTLDNNNFVGILDRYLYYSYAKSSSKAGELAEVPSALTAIGADALMIDEASQIVDTSIAYRRVEKSRLPSPIIREIGTPGGGGGIERRMNAASIYLYPHYTCPHCGHEDELSPLTCLITELDNNDKPIKWHYQGSRMNAQTAVFKCANCLNIIDENTRQNAYLKCKKSGLTTRDLDNLDDLSKHDLIALHFSPLMKAQDNLARRIINQANSAKNIADYWQQVLGLPSKRTTKQFTENMVTQSTKIPPMPSPVVWRVMGIDVGKHGHHCVILECVFEVQRNPIETLSATYFRVVDVMEINWDDIPNLILHHDIVKCAIDFKPETYTVAKVAYNHSEILPCEQVAQKGLNPMMLKNDDVSGLNVQVARIDTNYFMDAVYSAMANYRFYWDATQPYDWVEHFSNIYCANDKWEKVGGSDHWAYATMFAISAHFSVACL